MTVKELILALLELDMKMQVFVETYEGRPTYTVLEVATADIENKKAAFILVQPLLKMTNWDNYAKN